MATNIDAELAAACKEMIWFRADPARLRAALDAGADPRAGGNFALKAACFGGHPDLVARLLQGQNAADLEDPEWPGKALVVACGAGHREVVVLLLGVVGAGGLRAEQYAAPRYALSLRQFDLFDWLFRQGWLGEADAQAIMDGLRDTLTAFYVEIHGSRWRALATALLAHGAAPCSAGLMTLAMLEFYGMTGQENVSAVAQAAVAAVVRRWAGTAELESAEAGLGDPVMVVDGRERAVLLDAWTAMKTKYALPAACASGIC